MKVINEYRHRDDSGMNKILPFGEPSVRFCRGGFEPFIGILEVKVLSLEICKIGERSWIHSYNM